MTPKPKPRKQVNPIIAIVIIVVVLVAIGVYFYKGLQTPQYSEEERKPPKAFLDMLSKSQGGKQGAIGSNMRNPNGQPTRSAPQSR